MNLDGPLIDALLEHGITDKQLTLVKNLDAVEYLLETLHHEYEGECIACGGGRGIYRESHLRDCKVMLARIAIGQHTLEAELEAAENEARRENERRSAPRRAFSVAQADAILRNLYPTELVNAAVYADSPLLSLLPSNPGPRMETVNNLVEAGLITRERGRDLLRAAPQRMLTCPHCNSTSLTPMPNAQMLTCDTCQRTSSAERCAS